MDFFRRATKGRDTALAGRGAARGVLLVVGLASTSAAGVGAVAGPAVDAGAVLLLPAVPALVAAAAGASMRGGGKEGRSSGVAFAGLGFAALFFAAAGFFLLATGGLAAGAFLAAFGFAEGFFLGHLAGASSTKLQSESSSA